MFQVASWIRENDEPLFEGIAARHPEVQLQNSRTGEPSLERMAGVLITGGPDISAGFHRELTGDPSLIHDPEPERDAWEFAAVRRAMERGVPILCICKGFQVLNVALGGTLHFDIRGHDMPELKSANVQRLRYDSRARHRFETVNSSHHQALARVADALDVEGWSAADDIIEQVKIRDYPWGVGVQFHPERDATYYASLFDDFYIAVKS